MSAGQTEQGRHGGAATRTHQVFDALQRRLGLGQAREQQPRVDEIKLAVAKRLEVVGHVPRDEGDTAALFLIVQLVGQLWSPAAEGKRGLGVRGRFVSVARTWGGGGGDNGAIKAAGER